jgi:hypothetical protein
MKKRRNELPGPSSFTRVGTVPCSAPWTVKSYFWRSEPDQDCSRPKIRSGIRIRAQNRAESSGYGRKLHAKSSQLSSLAGRLAGGWLAGHAIGCKSQ